LNAFYDAVVTGGIVLFDELPSVSGRESRAVDEFFAAAHLEWKIRWLSTPGGWFVKAYDDRIISVDCRADGATKRVASVYAERGVVLCKGLLDASTDFRALRGLFVASLTCRLARFDLRVSDSYSSAVADLERVDHAWSRAVYDIVNFTPRVYALPGTRS